MRPRRRKQGVTNASRLKKRLSSDYRQGLVKIVLSAARADPKNDGAEGASQRSKPQPGGMPPLDRALIEHKASSAVEHLVSCGDWRKIVRLVESMSHRAGRGTLVHWFEQFGRFQVISGKLVFRPIKSPTSAMLTTARPLRIR